MLPAFRVARSTRLDALRETSPVGPGRATERLRSGLVVAEIAASVVLLVAAGLLMRAIWNVQQVDPGFRTDGVLTMRTALPWPAYRSTARREQFFDRVLTDIRALPGVQTAAYISFLPMVMRGGIWSVTPEGQSDDPASPHRQPSTSDARLLRRDADSRCGWAATFAQATNAILLRRWWTVCRFPRSLS